MAGLISLGSFPAQLILLRGDQFAREQQSRPNPLNNPDLGP